MVQDTKHKSLLTFIKKIIEVPLGLSKEDLIMFRSAASKDYPALIPIIDQYIQFAERSDTEVVSPGARSTAKFSRTDGSESMHLFDMLRDKRLFPTNSDLADFAGKILPDMGRNRFDKMSRSDIAARIIDYLETKDRRTRQGLEASMREAMTSGSDRGTNRKSFFSTWEKIIKGIEL